MKLSYKNEKWNIEEAQLHNAHLIVVTDTKEAHPVELFSTFIHSGKRLDWIELN